MASSILTTLSEYARSDSPSYEQKPVPHPLNPQSNITTPPSDHAHLRAQGWSQLHINLDKSGNMKIAWKFVKFQE